MVFKLFLHAIIWLPNFLLAFKVLELDYNLKYKLCKCRIFFALFCSQRALREIPSTWQPQNTTTLKNCKAPQC